MDRDRPVPYGGKGYGISPAKTDGFIFGSLYGTALTEENIMIHFGEIEIVSLPEMKVAVFEDISNEPEQATDEMAKAWLAKYGLTGTENCIRNFGFDCHKGREIPKNCRIYRRYIAIPENIAVENEKNLQIFEGGRFARMTITDPFSDDFPLGWGKILKWAFENGTENRLGCTSPDDCYSLFSNDESPCLEELYTKNGITYMDFFMPIV